MSLGILLRCSCSLELFQKHTIYSELKWNSMWFSPVFFLNQTQSDVLRSKHFVFYCYLLWKSSWSVIVWNAGCTTGSTHVEQQLKEMKDQQSKDKENKDPVISTGTQVVICVNVDISGIHMIVFFFFIFMPHPWNSNRHLRVLLFIHPFHPIPSHPIPSHLVLSYPMPSHPTPLCPSPSHSILSHPIPPHLVPSHLVPSHPIHSFVSPK